MKLHMKLHVVQKKNAAVSLRMEKGVEKTQAKPQRKNEDEIPQKIERSLVEALEARSVEIM